jgi:hypothetical protein
MRIDKFPRRINVVSPYLIYFVCEITLAYINANAQYSIVVSLCLSQ